jgi:hypothetical protein
VTPQGEWIPSLDCNQLQKGMEWGMIEKFL